MRFSVGPTLRPVRDEDLFGFLQRMAQESQFFSYAEALGLPEATRSTVAGAALARDSAVDQWNRWMHGQQGRDWFLVHQRYSLEEDHFSQKRGILLTAGTNVMVIHRCESVLATVTRRERDVFSPDGRKLGVGREEQVDLHCVLSPPHEDTLKVLPINVVPSVNVFNH